jgi:hypothetical protein
MIFSENLETNKFTVGGPVHTWPSPLEVPVLPDLLKQSPFFTKSFIFNLADLEDLPVT